MGRLIAIDVETASALDDQDNKTDSALNPFRARLLGLSVTDASGSTWYPWATRANNWPTELLSDPDTTVIGHNLRFDVKVLACNGITVAGSWEDTKLLAQLINENIPLGLKSLSSELIGKHSIVKDAELTDHLKSLKLGRGQMGNPWVNQQLVGEYCCEDTRNTWKLYHILSPQVTGLLRDYYYSELIPIEQLLMDMELRGVEVDISAMARAKAELTNRVADTQTRLEQLVLDETLRVRQKLLAKENAKRKTPKTVLPEFNWASPVQKTMLFYDELGLNQYSTEKTKTGKPALDRKSLSLVSVPEGKLKDALSLQNDLQIYTKLQNTYVEGLQNRIRNGRIHGEYYQATREEWKPEDDEGGTATGRLSHRNPNLGNLPRAGKDYWRGAFVKDFFVSGNGKVFGHADYSQIELRVAAHLSQDMPFIQAFNSGEDPHQQTADRLAHLGVTRQKAKTINFLLIYAGSPWRLCFELGGNPSKSPDQLAQAEQIHAEFFKAHPELEQWSNRVRAQVRRDGYVDSMFGRRRHLPGVWSADNKKVGHALRQAGNFVVQSAAASITKRAMIKLKQEGFIIVNQVHDSIDCLFDEDVAAERLKQMADIMTSVVDLSIPLAVDTKLIHTFKE